MIWPITTGLIAGALWALAFIAPGMIEPFGATDLTVVRYSVFGASSLLVLAFLRKKIWLPILRSNWLLILILAITGNTVYYLCLSESLQRSGTLLPTMIIGTLPVVMAFLGSLRNKTFSPARFLLPALFIMGGIVSHALHSYWSGPLVSTSELSVIGLILALAALASWAFYGIRNAEFLTQEKETNIVAWTALTGVATIVTLIPVAALLPSGPHSILQGATIGSGTLILWGLILGLLSSWVATWFWNIASRSLAGDVLGYLIVSETVFAIIYAFIIEQRLPTATELINVTLLVSGVSLGIRAASKGSRHQNDVNLYGQEGGGGA
ncbi:DMT family transporter [Rhodomicrobium sp.]|uniref:DMT family transporter n=1 Tax=Rhodomicrobium sp. TaxID=2720632 RepID=UPI0039E400DD